MGSSLKTNYDFCGWATRNDLQCRDGRVIRRGAFLVNDGQEVPLVWNHGHKDLEDVLGHALLENRDEGVYAYAKFNDSENGLLAKKAVDNGDITALSIYANDLQQNGNNVTHGVIREVSLVLAGANPGAYIEAVAHAAINENGEEDFVVSENEIILHCGMPIELYHAEKEETPAMSEEKKEEKKSADDKTVEDVLETLNDEQTKVVNFLLEQALAEGNKGESEDKNEEGEEEMKHNVFDTDKSNDDTLMHDGLNEIMRNAKRYGSLKESFVAHSADYGIENIDWLQPEDHDIYDKPEFIRNQPNGWIQTVLSGIHNTPFAKVRMMFADITEDEARARGYIKGNYKKEEVFKLLKRSVTPTTIYKKQKFDRDDLVDADFDIVPWIKGEMSMMLDEEKARAYIFGDGRSTADPDKINETNIIPVVADEDLFTVKKTITPEQDETIEHAVIDGAILAQDEYQGSGNTVGFFEQTLITRMLLMEDKFGHKLYKNLSEIANAMGVGKIEKVPTGVIPSGVYGVILDLKDYQVGNKDMGKKAMFDDFDIDYNQQIYLIETRQCGCLTRPKSAIVLKADQAAG